MRSRSLWEASKGVNIFTTKVHGTVHQLSQRNETVPVRIRFFFLSEIFGSSVARTSERSNTFWQSLLVQASKVLLYVCVYISWTNKFISMKYPLSFYRIFFFPNPYLIVRSGFKLYFNVNFRFSPLFIFNYNINLPPSSIYKHLKTNLMKHSTFLILQESRIYLISVFSNISYFCVQ